MNPIEARSLNDLWGRLIVAELLRLSITHFVVSPGSRSTPLTAALAEFPEAETIIHIDERGAAYYALGIARHSGRPVALICTSGTAAVNYFPAVVEASQDGVPLVVMTADRPPELHGVGANQTIEQIGLYGTYPRMFRNLPCPDLSISPAWLLQTVDNVVSAAVGNHPGPVQLNAMFREPLAPLGDMQQFDGYCRALGKWLESDSPYCLSNQSRQTASTDQLQTVESLLYTARRGLVVVGALTPRFDHDALAEWLEKLGWPVFADVRSQLRLDGRLRKRMVPPWVLESDWMAANPPDAILHIGGNLVGKRILGVIAASNAPYVRITDSPLPFDPASRVTHLLHGDLPDLLDRLDIGECVPDQSWQLGVLASSRQVWAVLDRELESETITEPAVARIAAFEISRRAGALFLGNSMPIRDVDLFGGFGPCPFPVYGNRGASGIDGNIATAAGIARASNRPVIALIGDLACLHDLNSLGLLSGTTSPMVVLVINNDGGGIFSFLPISQRDDIFEKYFGTPHGLRFADAAQMYGLAYSSPRTCLDLRAALDTALAGSGATIIEVTTTRRDNAAEHERLVQVISRELVHYHRDISLEYEIVGPADAPLVVFLHGFLGDRAEFAPLAERLAPRFRSLLVDLPGHGRSQTRDPRDYEMEIVADDIAALVRRYTDRPADLVGYSMGGRVAWHLLCRYPDLWRRAVVESSTPGIETAREREARVVSDIGLAKLLAERPLPEFLDYWYSLPLFSSLDKTSVDYKTMRDRRERADVSGLGLSLRQMGTGAMPSLWPLLHRIRAELLLICGERDEKFRQIAAEVCRRRPSTAMTVVANAGHMVHLEQAAEFERLVIAYLTA